MLFTDVMVMPKGSASQAAVAAWMDFVYTPAEAARIAAAVQYITPVQGVQELLAKDPATKALAANPLNFPDAALEARLKIFGPLDSKEEARFNERFATITSG